MPFLPRLLWRSQAYSIRSPAEPAPSRYRCCHRRFRLSPPGSLPHRSTHTPRRRTHTLCLSVLPCAHHSCTCQRPSSCCSTGSDPLRHRTPSSPCHTPLHPPSHTTHAVSPRLPPARQTVLSHRSSQPVPCPCTPLPRSLPLPQQRWSSGRHPWPCLPHHWQFGPQTPLLMLPYLLSLPMRQPQQQKPWRQLLHLPQVSTAVSTGRSPPSRLSWQEGSPHRPVCSQLPVRPRSGCQSLSGSQHPGPVPFSLLLSYHPLF